MKSSGLRLSLFLLFFFFSSLSRVLSEIRKRR